MEKRLIICAGGTGGHLYPAISVAEQIQSLQPNIEILFVGGGLAKNPFFQSSPYPFVDIPCSPFSFKGLKQIFKGIHASRKCLSAFTPDAILGFGSYTTFPTLTAALSKHIPIILHEGNSVPGKVNRLFAPFAAHTAYFFPNAIEKQKRNTLFSDFPLRSNYRLGTATKEEACRYFSLNPEKKTILIFGGSQGAKNLNLTFQETLKLGIATSHLIKECQFVHFTGEPSSAIEFDQFYLQHSLQACVKPFEIRMDLAWQAADLVLSRAGAGTIAEQIEFEVPGILIPYPYAADRHQDKNASFMSTHVRGAITLEEKTLSPKRLLESISPFLYTDNSYLTSMRSAIQTYKTQHQPLSLAQLVVDVLKKGCK